MVPAVLSWDDVAWLRSLTDLPIVLILFMTVWTGMRGGAEGFAGVAASEAEREGPELTVDPPSNLEEAEA